MCEGVHMMTFTINHYLGTRKKNPPTTHSKLGYWWNLQERFHLSLWWSSPNFKTIALLKQILVFALNIGDWKFWVSRGRVFFSSTKVMIDCKRHHMNPFTRSTRFKDLLLTLVLYHTTLLGLISAKINFSEDFFSLSIFNFCTLIFDILNIFHFRLKVVTIPARHLALCRHMFLCDIWTSARKRSVVISATTHTQEDHCSPNIWRRNTTTGRNHSRNLYMGLSFLMKLLSPWLCPIFTW